MPSRLAKIRNSVIKVHTQSDAPDYDQPWQKKGVESSAGSALIVSTRRGPRVLTNAHVVQNQVFVQVRRYGQATKYVAEVEGVGHECDLALLSVADDRFFRGATPIRVGELPTLGQQVTVLGYPVGGERLSVTRTEIPVGRWTRSTPVSTLLTFWPPGPEARRNDSTSSLSGRGRGFMRRPG